MSPVTNLQLGVIGLGTMGANLARNAARNGAKVVVFNRTFERTQEFMKAHEEEGSFVASKTLKEFVKAMKKPRSILVMVKAGEAVDLVLEELVPLLEKGDIIIDGGNSHFRDTERREKELKKKGIAFMGLGVSGGEEGALNGPSLMPGGDAAAYKKVLPILSKMAAEDGDGGRCIAHLGPGGAGHFVKMVHNGIEYALMQLLAESYDALRTFGNFSADDLSKLFGSWNQGPLQSFLLQITAEIFAKKDAETGQPLLDLIVDAVEQKGTGKWTVQAAAELHQPIPLIALAVDARILSADPGARKPRAALYPESLLQEMPERKQFGEVVRSSYLLSSIVAYTQGLDLIQAASKEYGWDIPVSEVARIWRSGCIIRSNLLPMFQKRYATGEQAEAAERELAEFFRGEPQSDWRSLVANAVASGLPLPCFSAALAHYDTIRRLHLPQNLVAAQRDYFGAHTYKRIDKEGVFHTEWRAA